MDKAINQLGQIESNYIDRLRRIAPLLSDKEMLESVAANTPNAANMGKTMKSEAASKLGIFNKPEVQAPSAQDLSQFIVPMEPEPEAPTAQDFAQFMKPMEPEPQPEPTYQDFSQFMKPRPRAKFNQPSTQPQAPKAQAPKAQDSAQSIELKSKLLLDLFKKIGGGWRRMTVSEVNEVRDLLNSGANPNIKDEYGNPLLHDAVTQSEYKENHEIVKLLLKAGAEPNIKDKYGHTTLGSVQPTDVKTIRLLLKSGANPNLPSYWEDGSVRYDPIHSLIRGFYDGPAYFYKNRLEFKEKKLESLRLLLQYGADPTNKVEYDGFDRNALEYARYNYDTYGPESGHFLEEVELIEEYMERMNRKKIGKVSVKEGRVFTQAGLGRRRSRKKKKSKNKKLKKGGKRSNKKSGKTLKKKRK
jgi:hypothetical protein